MLCNRICGQDVANHWSRGTRSSASLTGKQRGGSLNFLMSLGVHLVLCACVMTTVSTAWTLEGGRRTEQRFSPVLSIYLDRNTASHGVMCPNAPRYSGEFRRWGVSVLSNVHVHPRRLDSVKTWTRRDHQITWLFRTGTRFSTTTAPHQKSIKTLYLRPITLIFKEININILYLKI